MKQLTNSILRIKLDIDLASVEKVEFAFSQTQTSAPKKLAVYPSDEVINLGGNVLGVVWSAEETRQFVADNDFYVDTRIKLYNSDYNPETKMATAFMERTLFREE